MTDEELIAAGWVVERSEIGLRISRGGVVLWLGDCVAVLPLISGVDAVVTDPPYGVKFVKGRSGGQGLFRGKRSAADARHDRVIEGDSAPFDPSHLLPFGNVLMWGANHYCHRIPEGMGRWLVWNKLEGVESFDSFGDVDFAWHSKGKASRIINYMWKNGLVCRKQGEDNGRRSHPTQKPVGVMLWCLEQVGAAKRILDPYMGSGSTGVACVRAGREFVGIEIDQEWFWNAVSRIGRELLICESQKSFIGEPEAIPAAPENGGQNFMEFESA